MYFKFAVLSQRIYLKSGSLEKCEQCNIKWRFDWQNNPRISQIDGLRAVKFEIKLLRKRRWHMSLVFINVQRSFPKKNQGPTKVEAEQLF